MADTYRLWKGRRLLNALVRVAVRLGIAPKRFYLLTVRGRTSGRLHCLPIIVLSRGVDRWLIAPYGERAWVKNARAAGRVTLSRGRQRQTLAIREVGPEEAAPVLQQYLSQTPITRKFFDVPPEARLADFVREAPRHPVFRLVPPSPAPRGPGRSGS